LNFKLKQTIYIRYVETKLIIRQKTMQTIINFIWDLLITIEKQVYFAIIRFLFNYEVTI